MNSLTQSTNTTILPVLIALTLGCFGVSPTARAVVPPPDGGYPNFNTAEGEDALFSLTTGANNTAVGFHALFSNVKGDNNTAVGSSALQNNTKGLANTAIGALAMQTNTTGNANAAFGMFTLFNNSTGFRNTAIGVESLKKVNGSDNTGLGYEAGMNIDTGSFTICIGNPGVSGDTNTIRIGTTGVQTATFIAGISGVTVPSGVGVIVDNNGKLGTIVSSARYKEGIKPMDKASEAILSLQPVTFRYKQQLDPDGIPQFGLVAEDVEKVNPNLVARDDQGKPYTVRYEAVNAMLLNEFLKEHRKVEQQQATITQLKSAVAKQESAIVQQGKNMEVMVAGLKAQAAQIQKVSEQLATSQSAAKILVGNSVSGPPALVPGSPEIDHSPLASVEIGARQTR